MNLSKKILTFIGYCLKETGFRYSYEKIAEALERVDKKRYSVATLRKEFSNLKRNGFITYEPRCRRKIPTLTPNGPLTQEFVQCLRSFIESAHAKDV